MRAKVGEHSGCCIWLGFDQAGTEEAAQLPAARSRLPRLLLETHLGLGRQEKSKLPQTCRHKSGKRNGGRAVCEVLVSSDLGGCMLKITPCHCVVPGAAALGTPAPFGAARRMGTLWVLRGWLWQEG